MPHKLGFLRQYQCITGPNDGIRATIQLNDRQYHFQTMKADPHTHIIKLYDKQIKVHLQYQSPPKSKKQQPSSMKTTNLHSYREKENASLYKFRKIPHLLTHIPIQSPPVQSSPQFYRLNIQQSNNMLEEYQKLHRRMLGNEGQPRRLKVYSNSKQLKKIKDDKATELMLRDITSKLNQKSVKQVPIRKIRLYSPSKKSANKQNQNQKDKESLLMKTIKATPERRHKLEVISSKSKSRNKYDSILSNKQQISLQLSKNIKPTYTPQKMINSFQSMSEK